MTYRHSYADSRRVIYSMTSVAARLKLDPGQAITALHVTL